MVPHRHHQEVLRPDHDNKIYLLSPIRLNRSTIIEDDYAITRDKDHTNAGTHTDKWVRLGLLFCSRIVYSFDVLIILIVPMQQEKNVMTFVEIKKANFIHQLWQLFIFNQIFFNTLVFRFSDQTYNIHISFVKYSTIFTAGLTCFSSYVHQSGSDNAKNQCY